MAIHQLKILPEYFEAIKEGFKNFEIRKNDRHYQVGDLLFLKEFKDGKFTGYETMHRVTFITDYEQKEGFVVMSINHVPKSFKMYTEMSDKEKAVFKEVINHIHLYGNGDRDVCNTFWDIINVLIDENELSDTEQQWYMEFWEED